MTNTERLAQLIHNAIAEEAIHQNRVSSWSMWHDLSVEDKRVMTLAIDGLISRGVIS